MCNYNYFLSSKFGLGSGELSNIWHYNCLRKENTPKTGAHDTNRTLSDFPSQNSLHSTQNTLSINVLNFDLLSYAMNCVSSKK